MRYIRNPLCEDNYMLSLKLFTLRLLKAGYTKGFIHRNVISYKEGLYRMKFKGHLLFSSYKFHRLQTSCNNSQQRATGCANGRNM